MIKRTIFYLIILISFSITNIGTSKNKNINKFIKYGVSFKHLTKYKVTPSEEKGYKRIILESTQCTIIADVYPYSFKDKVDEIIRLVMKGVVYSFKKDGYSIKESKLKRTFIRVKVQGGKEKVKLEANIVKVVSQQKGKDSIKTRFYFFSYNNKGYIISYSHLAKINKSKEFLIFAKSFTIY